jgi:hypothetical protein
MDGNMSLYDLIGPYKGMASCTMVSLTQPQLVGNRRKHMALPLKYQDKNGLTYLTAEQVRYSHTASMGTYEEVLRGPWSDLIPNVIGRNQSIV